jgi:drug/metabolite transporter (DMT)-like permease
VTLLLAIAASISIAAGMFLTKGVTLRLPVFQVIGPLFLLNAFFALPFLMFGSSWVSLNHFEIELLGLGGLLTAAGAGIIFLIVSRSSASASSVGQALSPAAVLLIAPFVLKSSRSVVELILVAMLIMATTTPLRDSVTGIRSLLTISLMVGAGISGGSITVIVALLLKHGIGFAQIIVIQQLIAGALFFAIVPPAGIRGRDYFSLAKRSMFMSAGWLFSSRAIQSGSPLLVQSVMATVPLFIVILETIIYKKRPTPEIVFSALVTVVGISALTLLT